MITTDRITAMAQEIVLQPGIVGVALGGSRARGDYLPTSDVDLGVYYEATFDAAAFTELATHWAGRPTPVTEPGGWGPWVDAGGWLTVDGTAVDWILRDVGRVRDQWERAQRGEFAFHAQPGHPLGFLDVAYVGEVVRSRILADPKGALTALKAECAVYPDALRHSMIEAMWESGFLVSAARKAVPRGDSTYVASCVSRALLLAAHAIHAHAGRWPTNEKGLVHAAGELPAAPAEFAPRAAHLMAALGTTTSDLIRSLDTAQRLIDETWERVHDNPSATD